MTAPILPDRTAHIHKRIVCWSDEWRSQKFTGIIRVSTSEQADYGYVSRSLDAQADELAKFKLKYGLDFDGSPLGFRSLRHPYFYKYTHTAIESGKSWGRDVTASLKHASSKQRVLVCCGLDRFSRQSLDRIIAALDKYDIKLLVLDLGRAVDPDEIESGVHAKREKARNTKRGLIFKKTHMLGKPCGRPRKLKETEADAEKLGYILLLSWAGESLESIARNLNSRQRSPGRWSKMDVWRILKRSGALCRNKNDKERETAS